MQGAPYGMVAGNGEVGWYERAIGAARSTDHWFIMSDPMRWDRVGAVEEL